MASFYDSASIITIPSGYKAGTLYSAKPTDGTGDMDFTRTGDTATRVNSSGIIERCITNLLLNSATLSTQSVTLIAQPYTLSIFGTGSVVITGTGSGTLTGTGASNRVSLTFTPTAGVVIFTVTGSVTTAQLQTGDIATNYIATAGTAVTQGPVTNLPRLDYFGSTCPQLLMEPTRTNLETYSEIFNNSSWVKTTTSVSANVAVSPDGYQNADALIEDTNSGIHSIAKALSFVSGTTYTISCFVKQGSGTRRFAIVTDGVAFGGTYICNFNLQTGVVVNSGAQIVGKIENYGNGWFRCSAVATATATATRSITFCLRNNDVTGISSYTGDGTSSLFIWGAQVEAGTHITSYIPTVAATVTRNQELATKGSISSLIGQVEGTAFIDFDYIRPTSDGNGRLLILRDSSENTNAINSMIFPSNQFQLTVSSGGTGTNVIPASSSTLIPFGRNKIAIAYNDGSYVVYRNGSLFASATSVKPLGTLTNIDLGNSAINTRNLANPINQSLVFKTRLTNAELATLTTL